MLDGLGLLQAAVVRAHFLLLLGHQCLLVDLTVMLRLPKAHGGLISGRWKGNLTSRAASRARCISEPYLEGDFVCLLLRLEEDELLHLVQLASSGLI